ncbi:hypothetical protein HPHPP28B_1272 [Helicobacter pylori Hp P-28b]|nr:hypothetical protein HPHPP28B_1272 [Helicobacter pylori Hp P-28b]
MLGLNGALIIKNAFERFDDNQRPVGSKPKIGFNPFLPNS